MVVMLAYTVVFPLVVVVEKPSVLLPLAPVALAAHVPISLALRAWLGLNGLAVGLAVTTGLVLVVLLAAVSPRMLELAALGLGRVALGLAALAAAAFGLVSLALTRAGVHVVSVDALPPEVELWRRLAPEARFELADGRALPYADASFDRAYSLSVLEHIPEGGDERALNELARVVRSGGRILLTVPYANTYWEDWRDRPVYGVDDGADSRFFFERWYDSSRPDR